MPKPILDYTGPASVRKDKTDQGNVYCDHHPIAELLAKKVPIDGYGWWHGRLHILVELVEEGDDG